MRVCPSGARRLEVLEHLARQPDVDSLFQVLGARAASGLELFSIFWPKSLDSTALAGCALAKSCAVRSGFSSYESSGFGLLLMSMHLSLVRLAQADGVHLESAGSERQATISFVEFTFGGVKDDVGSHPFAVCGRMRSAVRPWCSVGLLALV